ncbi:MAG: cadherin-like domain-containing protein [gamma proteobacterium endosymbiont of Lamellibrachia anaximandri]|nr:cadherin-like domain-containing protein [gamma proteobacterium endosymbiont of Lamellibrachia anaximandri]MBL3617924.1 cadherin-like domain-containing protein [gamma proteobacterium endosymbiont of Lamellibrachia anaximandri]
MKALHNIFAMVLTGILVTACGGGDAISEATTSNRVEFGGSVGDGPVVGATVTIRNRNFEVISSTTSDNQANFSYVGEIADEQFPLIIEATLGIDLVTNAQPDFTLTAVVMDRSQTRINLNPHSTMIVKTALAMSGGLNLANLNSAREAVITKMNFGLDTALVTDPITNDITDNNVAVITKASEVFGEMVRRASYWIGNGIDEDAVFAALAADLTDGALDGIGGPGTNARYTAIAHVVSAQVLIEAMLNDLQVNNASATLALDNAIEQIMGNAGTANRSTTTVTINDLMIEQAKFALAAARAIDPNVTFDNLLTVLFSLGSDVSTTVVSQGLGDSGMSGSVTVSIDQSISLAASSNTSDVSNINVAANSPVSINTDGGNTDGGATPTDHQPVAQADSASTIENSAVTINLLSNDSGLEDGPVTLTVSGSASHGTLQVNTDGTVTYSPASDYRGVDSFIYQITDADGDSATASVNLTVNCLSQCSSSVRIAWNASTGGDVASYNLYHRTGSGNYGNPIAVGNVVTHDLDVDGVGNHYFVVTAVNLGGHESSFSSEVSVQL